MKVKFWGVRGSIPTPGESTVRYGGNTSCIELNGDDGTLIIFDAGTGIRLVGGRLASKPPVDIHLFLSHTHWDHIHGFPFFIPAFIPSFNIHIYGPPHYDKSVKEIMSQQMVYSYFPVTANELQAKISYRDLKEETITIGDLNISTKLMNHPVSCYAYRVIEGDKTVIYTGDNEPYYNFISTGETSREENREIESIVEEQNNRNVDFVRGADLLIAEAQYTDEEFPSKLGWGHSSTTHALKLAINADVKHMVIFHHDPAHTDELMDRLYEQTLQKYSQMQHTGLKISVAMEGQEIVV
ncbi:MAG: MBL fold metallo-hydrolase [Nitrospirae bacterium]|nr:MBL fold metallo-hydrolase [Nitrospirota bacterium]